MKPETASQGCWWIASFCVAMSFCSQARAVDPASLEFFEAKIRPILVERCQKCHGEEKQKGGLRLDSRPALIAGGETGPSVDLEKPDESLLIEVIGYASDTKMPPKSKLSQEEIDALSRWVAMGLPWTESDVKVAAASKPKAGFDLQGRKAAHWAWAPVVAPPLPAVQHQDWPIQPLDAFILAKLEANELEPAASADKRALIRRASYDLIGLPPTVEEVDAFLADASPKAFENLVDRLLASPKFGERWARHWLDLMRFGESRGHEFDATIPNAFQYRDYVIRALNANVPYNQFVTEHLAGDLLPEPRTDAKTGVNESILGTGFWFLGEEVHSPVDIRQDEADRFDNRIDVMSKAFLGLTVSCARCHDHKFDAISQRDYYALSGFLASSDYRQVRFASQGVEKSIAQGFDDINVEANQKLPSLIAAATAPALKHVAESLLGARQEFLNPQEKPNPANRAWVDELKKAKDDPRHPLSLFVALACDQASAGDDSQAFKARLQSKVGDRAVWKGIANDSLVPSGRVVADFRIPMPLARSQDGFSYGLKTRSAGELVFGMGNDLDHAFTLLRMPAAVQEPSWATASTPADRASEHGRLGHWNSSGKTLRSPEIRCETGRLWYLVDGPGHAYAAVNSHHLVEGPLHRGLLLDWAADPRGWHWVRHDLLDYKRFRNHIEFAPEGHTPLSVALIVDSDTEPLLRLPQRWMHLKKALAAARSTLRKLWRMHTKPFSTTRSPSLDRRVSTPKGKV